MGVAHLPQEMMKLLQNYLLSMQMVRALWGQEIISVCVGARGDINNVKKRPRINN